MIYSLVLNVEIETGTKMLRSQETQNSISLTFDGSTRKIGFGTELKGPVFRYEKFVPSR